MIIGSPKISERRILLKTPNEGNFIYPCKINPTLIQNYSRRRMNMAWTNIKKVTNQQPANAQGGVAFANQQTDHAWESWACAPGFDDDTGRHVPVPQTSNFQDGLWIYTIKGRCQVIDNDWTITGKWDCGNEVILIPKGQGAGSDVQATIDAAGNITMRKA